MSQLVIKPTAWSVLDSVLHVLGGYIPLLSGRVSYGCVLVLLVYNVTHIFDFFIDLLSGVSTCHWTWAIEVSNCYCCVVCFSLQFWQFLLHAFVWLGPHMLLTVIYSWEVDTYYEMLSPVTNVVLKSSSLLLYSLSRYSSFYCFPSISFSIFFLSPVCDFESTGCLCS